ncbi:DUF6886 family protein [Micromonospora sp. NPDC049460]|uniref:DUF6886 family protein n=1 Tax=unclassified Micromonospora TaxID=2617518 RepID=UPI003710DD4B
MRRPRPCHRVRLAGRDANGPLFAYRLPADRFRPFGVPEPRAHVAVEPIEPLGPPEPVGDLLDCHAEAGIQLRVLNV